MFFLAMILNPLVQKRAQEEIDRVIGHERLPDIADKDALPYVRSVITEIMRWYPVLPLGLALYVTEDHRLIYPLGLARAASADDIYEGQFIPKGSFVIPNLW